MAIVNDKSGNGSIEEKATVNSSGSSFFRFIGLKTDAPTLLSDTGLRVGHKAYFTGTKEEAKWSGDDWVIKNIDGAALFAEVGIPNSKHDRPTLVIDATWPGDNTYSYSFSVAENVRSYTVKAIRIAKDLWTASQTYAVGTFIHPNAANDLVFEVTASIGTGVGSASEPTWPDVIGETVVDESSAGVNGVTWTARNADSIYLKYTTDALNETQEEAWLTTATTGLRDTDVEYRKAFDGVATKLQSFSISPSDIPLSRIGFLAIADTWEVTLEAE